MRVRILGPGAVVVTDRLARREQVVREPARHQHRRRGDRVVDVVRRVVLGDLIEDRLRLGAVGLAGLDGVPPARDVGRRVGADRGVEAGCRAAREVEAPDQRLLLDADPAAIGRVGHVVERAAVWLQRVREVGPRDAGGGGRDLHRLAARARPGDDAVVGHHLAVAQGAERHGHAAAVGPADRADALRVDQALVGELAGELLRVANLVAVVDQADVAVGAGGRSRVLGCLRAARLVKASIGHREGGVAAVEPVLHPTEPDLVAAVAVEDHDQRIVAVRP